MRSVILSAFAKHLFVLMIAVSLYVLYRGHNEPGGGFVGGLIAASAFTIVALAEGARWVRRALRVDPTIIMGLGFLCALVSGLPGLLIDGSYLTHQWTVVAGTDVGTALLFDVGVYLVVLGGVLALLLRFYEGL